MHALALWLADGRLPTGGHAHSGGLEAAVAAGLVADVADLEAWCAGRLATAGRVDACVAAAAWGRPDDLAAVVDEWAARTPVPAVRAAAVAQGRGLLRTARRAVGATVADGDLPWPAALGVVAAACDVDVTSTCVAAAHAAVAGPAWAATRLLSCDPLDVAAVLARLSPAVDDVGTGAVRWADPTLDLADLPAASAPLLDIGAAAHAGSPTRLFAS